MNDFHCFVLVSGPIAKNRFPAIGAPTFKSSTTRRMLTVMCITMIGTTMAMFKCGWAHAVVLLNRNLDSLQALAFIGAKITKCKLKNSFICVLLIAC